MINFSLRLFILVLNNIFNLLVTINAASNFILYCLLSDKYRKTVKQLFCGVGTIRRNTLSSSRFTSARTTSSYYSRSRNSTLFNMPLYKPRGPRFSISKEEYANLQAETAKRNRFSASQSRNNSIVSYQISQIACSKKKKNDFAIAIELRIYSSLLPRVLIMIMQKKFK